MALPPPLHLERFIPLVVPAYLIRSSMVLVEVKAKAKAFETKATAKSNL